MNKAEISLKRQTDCEEMAYSEKADRRSRNVGCKFAHAIRLHWGIESCHWVLDVAFNEDSLKARAGHIAENLSLIRKMGMALLKKDTQTPGGIELRRKQAGWDPDYLLHLLGIKF